MLQTRQIVLLFLALLPLRGQEISGNISGTVSDNSGAVIVNAGVQIRNAATGVLAFNGKTNESGAYSAPALPSGQYNVVVESAGFKRAEIKNVTLQLNQRARVDAVLALGNISDTVTVVGEGLGQLEADSSSIGAVINTSQVRDLPLPSRNVLNLLTLVGGISSGGAATGINSSQLSINGSRTLNSEFTIDGVSIVSGSTGAPQRVPSTEAVREFRVLTSGYTAEYGRTSGGFISVITDSGTNLLHGSLYEYFRNEDLNANNFFNNLRGQARQADRYNQFGGKLGGPVRIPKLYNGKDKTFFFFNYEGLRRQIPFNNISSVPDAASRAGNLSAAPLAISDPIGGGSYPNNQIPAARLDPAARKVLALLPLPNSPGTLDAANGRFINNYISAGATSLTDNQYLIRGDHNVGSAARFFGRLSYFKNTAPSAPVLPGVLDTRVGDSITTGYQASTSWTHVWSPTLLTETFFGFQRNNPKIDPPSLGVDVQQTLGIQRSTFAATPRINVSGFASYGIDSNTYRRQIDNTFQFSGSATKTNGNHTFKGGYQMRKNQFNVFNPGGNFAGIYNFNGKVSSPQRTAGNPIHALADFLQGYVQTANYDLPQPTTGRRNYNLGIFFQDDWKVTRRLTVNLGLRWEFETPQTIANDIYSRVDIVSGKLLVAGKNASRTLNLEAAKKNFAPRVGFAYGIGDKTVVRSAFGIFYSQSFSNLGGVVLYPGFTVAQQFQDLGIGIPQPFRFVEGIPQTAVGSLNDPFLAERNASASNPLSSGASFGQVSPLSKSLQWNFGIQREIFGGTIVDVNYVGTRGLHLPLSLSFNQVPFERGDELARLGNALATQQARPFPNVDGLGAVVNAGTSSYHSLQLKAVRRFNRNFSWNATYTYSKSIDDGTGLFNFSQPNGIDSGQFPNLNRRVDRSISSFDRTNSFATSLQYRTGGPFWLRGFTIAPIVIARTGLPDTITQTNVYPGITQQRPNTTGSNLSAKAGGFTPEGTGVRYLLSPASPNFPFLPSGPFYSGTGATRTLLVPAGLGGLGRNTTREPGEFNIDLSVARTFPIRDRARFEIRAEAFNFLNHTNFNAPNTALSLQTDAAGRAVFNSPGFGLITSAKSARFVQLVARFEF